MRPLVHWPDFLREHGIPYVDRGPNVKRGHINIKCPMCGSADPSYHMGLEPETGFWGCWRNSMHRGKSPLRLIVALLNVPYWKARKIAGITGDEWRDPDGFDAVAARIMGRDKLTQVEHVRREVLHFPREFIPLSDVRRSGDRFFDYLKDERAFGHTGAHELAENYDVHYALRGPFKDRVVFPYYMEGELIAWTGRAIAPASIRYRDLEVDDCLVPIKEALFNYDCVQDGGIALLVQEGPIDALKIDVFGKRYGIRSVALSTNSMSAEQLYLLEEASTQFKHVIVVMDTATELGIVDSMRMKGEMRTIPNLLIRSVPYGCKDSGALHPRQADRWTKELAKELM